MPTESQKKVLEVYAFLSNLQQLRTRFDHGVDVREELEALEVVSPVLEVVSPVLDVVGTHHLGFAAALEQLRFPKFSKQGLPPVLESCLQEISGQELSQELMDHLLAALEAAWHFCEEAKERQNSLETEQAALERRLEAVRAYLDLLEFWSAFEPARKPK